MRKVVRLPPSKEDGRPFMAAQGQKLATSLRKRGVRYDWVCDAANNGHASVTIMRVDEHIDNASLPNVSEVSLRLWLDNRGFACTSLIVFSVMKAF